MRHFLCVTLAPGALSRRVTSRSTGAELIALARAPQRFAPASRGARTAAVDVAAVAVAADVHLLAAATAVVEPMGRFGQDARSPADWTTPCIAGIKAMQTCASRAPACRRPGVLAKESARAFAFCAPLSITERARVRLDVRRSHHRRAMPRSCGVAPAKRSVVVSPGRGPRDIHRGARLRASQAPPARRRGYPCARAYRRRGSLPPRR